MCFLPALSKFCWLFTACLPPRRVPSRTPLQHGLQVPAALYLQTGKEWLFTVCIFHAGTLATFILYKLLISKDGVHSPPLFGDFYIDVQATSRARQDTARTHH